MWILLDEVFLLDSWIKITVSCDWHRIYMWRCRKTLAIICMIYVQVSFKDVACFPLPDMHAYYSSLQSKYIHTHIHYIVYINLCTFRKGQQCIFSYFACGTTWRRTASAASASVVNDNNNNNKRWKALACWKLQIYGCILHTHTHAQRRSDWREREKKMQKNGVQNLRARVDENKSHSCG